jgi:hypothetical protein
MIAACRGYDRQTLRIHGWTSIAQRHDEGVQGRDAMTQTRWQHLLQLQERTHRRLFDAGNTTAGGGSQPERNGDGFLIIEQQWRQSCPGANLVPPPRFPRSNAPGIPGCAGDRHRATQSSACDIETMREIGSRPMALHLKQRRKPEQSG